MKTVICVVVYNRFENIKTWINCWNQCNTENSELRIIHNYINESEINELKTICSESNITYIKRKNVGMDIGAFQEICRNRLNGFNYDFEYLIWATDDCFPMRKDFVNHYRKHMILNPNVGVISSEISKEYKPHIRTTGFMIRRELLNRLTFPFDPILTKEHCYQFEHKSKNAFYEQIKKLGFQAVQIDSINTSPFWDSGHRESRLKEFNSIFNIKVNKINPKVFIICPAYHRFPQIISSMLCQTFTNWELHLIHDGLNENFRNIVETYNDQRIVFHENPERLGKYGHPYRQMFLNYLKEGSLGKDCNYVLITNEDNYHTPNFLDKLIKPLEDDSNYVASYCSDIIHSYKDWGILNCRLALGYIDCAQVIVRKEVACDVGWKDIDGHSSDWTYFNDIIKKYGNKRWIKVNGCLLVHN